MRWFCKKIGNIISVGQYPTHKSPTEILSVTKTTTNLYVLLFYWLLDFHFFLNCIVLWFSWCNMLYVTLYNWDVKKYFGHRIIGIISSTPTISNSVEILVFNFCFLHDEYPPPPFTMAFLLQYGAPCTDSWQRMHLPTIVHIQNIPSPSSVDNQ